MRRIENDHRNNLGEESLSHLMGMVMDGKPYVDHDSTKAIEVFPKQKSRKKLYTERKRSGNAPTNSGSKKVKKQKIVQKTLYDLAKN